MVTFVEREFSTTTPESLMTSGYAELTQFSLYTGDKHRTVGINLPQTAHVVILFGNSELVNEKVKPGETIFPLLIDLHDKQSLRVFVKPDQITTDAVEASKTRKQRISDFIKQHQIKNNS